MKKIILSALCLACGAAFSAEADVLDVKTYTLDNGMEVWINEDHSSPTAFGAVVVKAGSRDCPGSGIAHYFEHMMFKGTSDFGTVNYGAEKEYLDSIVVMYDSLALVKDAEQRRAIQMEINRLSIAASKYAIPNEFDALITYSGGADLNAFTSEEETVYHNSFIPAYFAQWAQINADRLRNPVFRLFQSELETVYEEKNMYSDQAIQNALETMMTKAFTPTPYAPPIIGYTDELKNPQLSRMADFFERYYVAGNMGLVVCGDVKAEEILPDIERTFGTLRRGEDIERGEISFPPYEGRRFETIPIDLPLIKIGALIWQAPAKSDPDYETMMLLSYILNNSEGVGLLDKFTFDGSMMGAMGVYQGFAHNDAGVFPIIFMPKIFGQSYDKAETLVLGALEALKKGDFSDELFESCKLSYSRELLSGLETLQSRAYEMIFALSSGLGWEEKLARIEAAGSITKQDVIDAANKYFTGNFLAFNKKSGVPEKDNLPKPPYEKVVPEAKDSASAYAQNFRAACDSIKADFPVVDFSSVTITEINPLVKLYSSANPVNDIFNLDIEFQTGTLEYPQIENMVSYVGQLGIEGQSYDEYYRAIQALGGSLGISSGKNTVKVSISGFDDRFEETLRLASRILYEAKGEKKKLSDLKSEDKASIGMSRKDGSTVAKALMYKAVYGNESPFLADRGKFTDDNLLGTWRKIQTVQCELLYTGNLSAEQVAATAAEVLDLDKVSVPSKNYPNELHVGRFADENKVLFVPCKGSSQANIYAVIPTGVLPDRRSRTIATYYNSYLGGGMTSLLFQEIREFRSMAYSTGSGFVMSNWTHRDSEESFLLSYVGTQCDKAIDAMHVVDSLLHQMPVREAKLAAKKIEYRNDLFDAYPDWRELPSYVQTYTMSGIPAGANLEKLSVVEGLTTEEMLDFVAERVTGSPVVWCVVGDPAKIDMESLKAFGKFTELKVEDVIK